MSTLNFYGPVGQAAGNNIINRGPTPRQRQAELIHRAHQHGQLRDAAANARWLNRWLALHILSLAALVACAYWGFTHRQLPGSPVVAAMIAATFFQWKLHRHRRHCDQQWRAHNDAIAAINRELAVL